MKKTLPDTGAHTRPRFSGDTRWPAFAMVLAAGFMTLLDVSIVNVALPSIENAIGANPTHLQWIVAGYSLAFGIVLVPAGRFGDVLGRRTVFLVGLTGFVLASLGCGLAPDGDVLVAVRLLQGVLAGVLSPQVAALIQELFHGRERAHAFALFGMTVGASTAVGPLLGGALVTLLGPEHGWRSVFLINVPIGLVVIPLAARLLPPPVKADRAGRGLGLDLLGLVLMGTTVLALMWPFVTGTSHHEGLAGAPWWLLGCAAVTFVALVVWERWRDGRGKPAVLPGVLVHDRGFVLGAALGSVYFAGMTGIFIVITLHYQQGIGAPALVAGLAQTPWAVASAIASGRSGHKVVATGRRTVITGLSTMLGAVSTIALVLALVPPMVGAWILPVLFAVAGWGGGAVIAPNQTLALAEVPVALSGTAAGLLQTLQRLGAAVGLALITTLFYAGLGHFGTDADGYARASATALVISIVCLAVALGIGVVDGRMRRHSSHTEGGHTA